MNLSSPVIGASGTRRDALKWLLAFSVAATATGVIAPIIAYLIPPTKSGGYMGPIPVGEVDDFPIGTGKVINSLARSPQSRDLPSLRR